MKYKLNEKIRECRSPEQFESIKGIPPYLGIFCSDVEELASLGHLIESSIYQAHDIFIQEVVDLSELSQVFKSTQKLCQIFIDKCEEINKKDAESQIEEEKLAAIV